MRSILNEELPFEEKQILLEIFPLGVISFDVETTGLSPGHHEIIEIAAIKLLPSGDLKVFHQLIKPKQNISLANSSIHGISNEDLLNSPSIQEVLPSFIDFIARAPLLAHNAVFDCGFLLKHCFDEQCELEANIVYDSLKIARGRYRKENTKPENFKLSSLAHFFDLCLDHHQALDDAWVTLRMVAKMFMFFEPKDHMGLLNKGNIGTLQQMSKGDTNQVAPIMNALAQYIENQRTVFISYNGGSYQGKFRPVRPLAVIPSPKGSSLYAECLIENIPKQFLLKKIKSIKAQNELKPEDSHVGL